jgi:hypothetical protein
MIASCRAASPRQLARIYVPRTFDALIDSELSTEPSHDVEVTPTELYTYTPSILLQPWLLLNHNGIPTIHPSINTPLPAPPPTPLPTANLPPQPIRSPKLRPPIFVIAATNSDRRANSALPLGPRLLHNSRRTQLPKLPALLPTQRHNEMVCTG